MIRAIATLISAYRMPLPSDAEPWERTVKCLRIQRAWDFLLGRGWKERRP